MSDPAADINRTGLINATGLANYVGPDGWHR